MSPRRERWSDPFAGMPGRRLFVAVPIPEDGAEAIRSIVDAVRAEPLPDAARDVRWVRLDGLHLTLRFLGPTPDDRLDATKAAVHAVAAAAAGPIDLALGGAGTFPPAGRPRALWVGIASGAQALQQLAADINGALAQTGWAPDVRPFRPHLTLARSDGVAAGRLVADRLAKAMAERLVETRIERLGLFESITGGGPARYVPVTTAPLGSKLESDQPVYHQETPGPP